MSEIDAILLLETLLSVLLQLGISQSTRNEEINKMTFDKFAKLVKLTKLPFEERVALVDRFANNKLLLRNDILKVCLYVKRMHLS